MLLEYILVITLIAYGFMEKLRASMALKGPKQELALVEENSWILQSASMRNFNLIAGIGPVPGDGLKPTANVQLLTDAFYMAAHGLSAATQFAPNFFVDETLSKQLQDLLFSGG